MKRRKKLVAAFVLASLSLCMVTPKVAEAGYYEFPAYFAADSYVRADGSWGWAYSANFECEGENQSVRVLSTVYYRNSSSGSNVYGVYRSNSDSGYDCYAEVEYTPIATATVTSVVSTHHGDWNGISLTEYTSDSI